VADRFVSVPMTSSDLERPDALINDDDENFQADLRNNAGTVWRRTTKYDRITRGGGTYF